MRSKISHRRLVGALASLAVVTALAGCSTGAGETDSGGETTAGDEVAERAMDQLEALYGTGTYQEPASEGPVAQEGHKVALVSSGVQNPTGTKQTTAAREAADALGWDLTIYDGKYDPAEYQEGVRQAVAQGVDAIWLVSVDCPLVQTALAEAKAAAIPVFSSVAADCNDVDPSAESYFAESLDFVEGDYYTWGEALGAAQAIWLLAQLGEEANIIEASVPELVITEAVSAGFNAKMQELCPSCEVTTVEMQLADFGPPMQEKIATALLRNPDANGLALSYDDLATAGGSAAVMESGRNDSLLVVGGTNFAPTMNLIRDDAGPDAGFAYDLGYDAWASADMINRYFAGEGPAPTAGGGLAVVDRDHGLPAEGEDWATDIDFRSAYKSIWGVS